MYVESGHGPGRAPLSGQRCALWRPPASSKSWDFQRLKDNSRNGGSQNHNSSHHDDSSRIRSKNNNARDTKYEERMMSKEWLVRSDDEEWNDINTIRPTTGEQW